MLGNFGQDAPSLLPYFMTFLFSFIYPTFEIEYCLLDNNFVGRNKSGWSISSGWFTRI